MKKWWIFLLLPLTVKSQPVPEKLPLQAGDIIFQNLACGELCQAILAVTPCREGKTFNHCGIVYFTGDTTYVIEAIGKAVVQTPLDSFLKRSNGKVSWARLKQEKKLAARAAQASLHYLGRPYDVAFLPGDSALYCSELVWECFQDRQGKKIFSLQPMTFKAPGTDSTFAGWKNYYQELGIPVPEGVPGINPCGIANEPFLDFYTSGKE